MLSYSRLLRVLQQNNLPQPEHLANQILNDYFSIDEAQAVESASLYASVEIIGKEIAIGKQLICYRNITSGFRIMAEIGEHTSVSLSTKHEMQDCLVRLAQKVLGR